MTDAEGRVNGDEVSDDPLVRWEELRRETQHLKSLARQLEVCLQSFLDRLDDQRPP